MVDEPTDETTQERGEDIVRTRIDPDSATAEYELLRVIADLGGVDIESLPSFYEQVGHFVEMLFQRPPAPEAQMEISFSYVGYRVRVTQTGQVTVIEVKESIEDC